MNDFCEIQLEYLNIISNTIVENKRHFANIACLVLKQMVYVAKCKKQKVTIEKVIREIKFIKKMQLNKNAIK